MTDAPTREPLSAPGFTGGDSQFCHVACNLRTDKTLCGLDDDREYCTDEDCQNVCAVCADLEGQGGSCEVCGTPCWDVPA